MNNGAGWDDASQKLPVLMITETGGCSHILKAKNAEDFGFRAVFIAVPDADY
jgi:hypothetical protein